MLLEIENVSRSFGGLVAVKDVSFSISKGEIVGLIGPNGAGKTTLLNVIAGFYTPHAGAIQFAGEDVTGLKPEALCRKGLSRTFQIPQCFPEMTALENVMVSALFGDATGNRLHPEERARQALESVAFPSPADTLACRLNSVQLKRLDLGRALASGPKLLLLDEIGAGLTPAELLDLIVLLRGVRERGVTLLIVEHLMRLIMELCDRVVVMQSGEKIAEGTPPEISQDANVVSAYLGRTQRLQ